MPLEIIPDPVPPPPVAWKLGKPVAVDALFIRPTVAARTFRSRSSRPNRRLH